MTCIHRSLNQKKKRDSSPKRSGKRGARKGNMTPPNRMMGSNKGGFVTIDRVGERIHTN